MIPAVYTISDHIRIAWKWLVSFRRRDWAFDDYPLRIRRNEVKDPAIAWVAELLNWPGPGGLGPTPEKAIEDFRSRFEELIKHLREAGEPIPRPGTRVPIRFASTSRIDANQELLQEFIQKVLGFLPGNPVFISDESSLQDFGDARAIEHFNSMIRSHFGVDSSKIPDGRIAEILEHIAAQRRNSTLPRVEVQVRMYRSLFEGYRPHFQVNEGEYLGISFESVSPSEEDSSTYRAKVALVYWPRVDYGPLTKGAQFKIKEGDQIVGMGAVISGWK
jgi:hypothetical protein